MAEAGLGTDERSPVAQENTMVSGVAGRYATALYELAREAKSVDAVAADLGLFDAMVAGNPDLQRFVRSPVFSSEEQVAALGPILRAAGMSVDEVPVVLDLIRRLKARGDRTILLVEHKMDVVRSLADRIVVLHNGRLVADGEPADVIASPIVQEAYLGVAAPAEAAHG